jgi:protein tyrosine/serine phosphatase
MSAGSFCLQCSSYQNTVAKFGHWAKFILFAWLVTSAAGAEVVKSDLPNFHAVHSYLLRGGEPSINGLKTLKDLGVDVIVDLRAPTDKAQSEKSCAKRLGMKYINLPMSSKPPTQEQVNTFLKAVDEKAQLSKDDAPQNKEEKYPHSVFVHCAHGSDRTGCMVGIWRVSRDHWSYEQAYKEMRKYYFGPQYKQLAEAVKQRCVRQ